MTSTLQTSKIEILELVPSLNEEKILLSMGVPKGKPVKKRLQRHIDEVLAIVSIGAKPKLLWKIAPTGSILREFTPSKRLSRYLDKPEYTALVIGTAGTEWEKRIHSAEDPMRAYMLNVAATALARDTHAQASRALAQRYTEYAIGEPISPGIDGLPFRLQAELIRQLPIEKIGLRFDAENLFMQPIASVTSIIGFGTNVKADPSIENCDEAMPNCPGCPDKTCTLRVMPFQAKPSHSFKNKQTPSLA